MKMCPGNKPETTINAADRLGELSPAKQYRKTPAEMAIEAAFDVEAFHVEVQGAGCLRFLSEAVTDRDLATRAIVPLASQRMRYAPGMEGDTEQAPALNIIGPNGTAAKRPSAAMAAELLDKFN